MDTEFAEEYTPFFPERASSTSDYQQLVNENGHPKRRRKSISSAILSLVQPALASGNATRTDTSFQLRTRASRRPRASSLASGKALGRTSPKRRSGGSLKVGGPAGKALYEMNKGMSMVKRLTQQLAKKASGTAAPPPTATSEHFNFGAVDPASTEDIVADQDAHPYEYLMYDHRGYPDVPQDISPYDLDGGFETRAVRRVHSDDSAMHFYAGQARDAYGSPTPSGYYPEGEPSPSPSTPSDKMYPRDSPGRGIASYGYDSASPPLTPITNVSDNASLRRKKSEMKLMQLLGAEAAGAVSSRK